MEEEASPTPGFPSQDPTTEGISGASTFRDPDGQVLEIATEGPGYAIDEPPESLGQSLIHPAEHRLPEGRNETAIHELSHPDSRGGNLSGHGPHRNPPHQWDHRRPPGRRGVLRKGPGPPPGEKTLNQDDGKTEHYFWANYDGETVAPHSSLTLFGWPGSGARARPGVGQTHHIAFRAESEDEQLAWRDHLLDLGIQVSPVQDRKYFKSIYFQAPDGLLLEIATDGPGFAVDERGELSRAELQLPHWLEGDRATIRGQSPIPGRSRAGSTG